MKRVIFIISLAIILALGYYYVSRDAYQSASYYASDSNSIVFEEMLEKGDKIIFFFDPKVLDGTESYLKLLNSKGEEVLTWDKERGVNDKNKGEFIINEDGQYTMQIFFTDDSLTNRNAEVEVDWKFVK